MAELDLPRGPAELLEAVRRPIGRHLGGEHHMYLGGGTALAARWAHRHSTDVDLFTDSKSYGKLFQNHLQFSDDLERIPGGVQLSGVGPGYTIIHLERGEITLLVSSDLTARPISADTVRGTRVSLETNAEILAKKLHYRLNVPHFVPRDLYDIAAARRHDPKALDTALAAFPADTLGDIRENLALLDRDWANEHPEPLLQPIHTRDAADSAAIVRRLIDRHLDGREPPAPRHPSISPDRGR